MQRKLRFVYVHMRGAMKTDPECIFIHTFAMQRKLLLYICTHVWSIASSYVCTHVWSGEDRSCVYTNTHVQCNASCVLCMYTCVER